MYVEKNYLSTYLYVNLINIMYLKKSYKIIIPALNKMSLIN